MNTINTMNNPSAHSTQTKPVITVRITSNYGTPTIYPACTVSKTFADICGTKTLTARVVKLIKQLGYDVFVEQQKLEV